MKENTEISERILQIIDFVDSNPNDFSKKLGYSRSQTIYDIINSKAKPSYDFFYKLLKSEYSDIICIENLITGEGELIKKEGKIIDYKENYLEVLLENRELRLEIDKLKKEKETLEKGKKLKNNTDSLHTV